jgi:hypothetical protein
VAIGCSLGTIATSLKTGVEILRGPAKGLSFVRLNNLPEGEEFEVVPNLQEKINEFNDKYWGKFRKNKR